MIFNGRTGGTTNIRIIISVIVIAGCFTVIYPRFFHPIMLKMLGIAPEKSANEMPKYPPHFEHGATPARGGRAPPDDVKRHMRPGPHPGMRASAEMNSQKQASSGRGGIMGMILPMYAIGIVAYLVYTLFKVFNKQGKGDIRQRQLEEQQRRRLGARGGPALYEERDDTAQLADFYKDSPEEKLSNIEDVLNNAEERNVSEVQMQELQRRLQETEAQMASILRAMNSVSSKVETATDPDSEKEQGETSKDKDTKSSDSSPDLSSYEVIGKAKGDKPCTPTDQVETLKAADTGRDQERQKSDGEKEKKEEDIEEEKEENITEEKEENIKKDKEEDENVEVEEVLLEEKNTEDDDGESSVRKRRVQPSSD